MRASQERRRNKSTKKCHPTDREREKESKRAREQERKRERKERKLVADDERYEGQTVLSGGIERPEACQDAPIWSREIAQVTQ
jgi:hypothetical protein